MVKLNVVSILWNFHKFFVYKFAPIRELTQVVKKIILSHVHKLFIYFYKF